MTAVAWVEPFTTINPAIWGGQFGVMPVAVGDGKIKFQRAGGLTCNMARVPFGPEGSLDARSVAMAFTVHPGESSSAWNLAAGSQQGTRPYFEPHANTNGFFFIDGTNRQYGGGVSGYHMYGDIQAPSTPYQIRVSAHIDVGTGVIYVSMSVDGVVVVDDYPQTTGVSWDPVLGYFLPYFYHSASDNINHVVIGGLHGIYGGTREENLAFVKGNGTVPSTLAPVFSLAGASLSVDATSNLPILYSRNLADIPANWISYSTTPEDLAATIYTAPFQVVSGETIYAATVAGNGSDVGYNGGYLVGTPVAYLVDIPSPPAPSIYPPAGAYFGSQMCGIVTESGYVRFTTDGSDPTEASEVFTRGFRITDGMTIKAIAVSGEGLLSSVSSATYAITGTKPTPIPSYSTHILPYLLEQYKGDNP